MVAKLRVKVNPCTICFITLFCFTQKHCEPVATAYRLRLNIKANLLKINLFKIKVIHFHSEIHTFKKISTSKIIIPGFYIHPKMIICMG